MRLLNTFLCAVVLFLLVAGLVLSEHHIPAYSLWVATPTDFPPALGSTAIAPFNVFQVETLTVLDASLVTRVSFCPNGTLLAFNGKGNTVKIHDIQAGRLLETLQETPRNASGIAFAPDGTFLATAHLDSFVRLWDVATGEEIAVLSGHTGELTSVAVSPDGALLASGSVHPDFTLRVWNIESREQIKVLRGADGEEFFDVAFSPDGTLLAAATGSVTYGKVRIWDVETWTLLTTLEGYSNLVSSIRFSHDGTFLVSGSNDGTIRKWEIGSRDNPTIHRYDVSVRSLDLTADDTLLAIGLDDSTIRLWDLMAEQEVIRLEGHTGPVRSVAISPDNRLLASGSMYPDETVRVWGIP